MKILLIFLAVFLLFATTEAQFGKFRRPLRISRFLRSRHRSIRRVTPSLEEGCRKIFQIPGEGCAPMVPTIFSGKKNNFLISLKCVKKLGKTQFLIVAGLQASQVVLGDSSVWWWSSRCLWVVWWDTQWWWEDTQWWWEDPQWCMDKSRKLQWLCKTRTDIYQLSFGAFLYDINMILFRIEISFVLSIKKQNVFYRKHMKTAPQ